MTALRSRSVVAAIFHRWIAGVFVIALAMTVAAQHAIAADPIAEIRLLRKAHVGNDVLIESIGQNVPEVHFFWNLDARPKLSRATISDHNSAQTSFRADVPGLYVVRLTVRLRNLTATATLDVAATETGPLVTVNTIDTSQGPLPVTVIGGQNYPDNTTGGKGLHVVIVDRNTLGSIQNTGYQLNQTQLQQMATDLGKLKTDGSVLVLVSLPASAGPVSSSLMSYLNTALNKIGGVIPEAWALGYSNVQQRTCWSSNQAQCYNNPAWQPWAPGWNGSFSVIGVPGMATGNAWYGEPRGTSDGALVGYLTPSVTVNSTGVVGSGSAYSFVFGQDQYVIVDTCASGGPSACVINVAPTPSYPYGQSFPPKNGVTNGMTVVLLDRVTLAPLLYETVTNTADLYSKMFYPINNWPSGHFFFGPYNANPVSDRTIVFLQSVGNGILTLQPVASGDSGTALLQVIDQVGGTPETFGKNLQWTGTGGPGPYALVGVAGNLPWHGKGIESSPIISSAQKGRSRGVLSRDRYGRYTPTTFDPQGTAILDMASIVYQAPQPWPYDGNCGIKWIAQGLGLPTDSEHEPLIRSGYTDTLTTWTKYDATKIQYPNPLPTGYCSSDNPFPDPTTYQNIQLELNAEFGWVEDTKTLIETLYDTVAEGDESTNTIVLSVASSIYSTIKPPSASTKLPWTAIADLAFAVVGVAVPAAQGVLGVMAASITVGTDLTASSPTANPAKQLLAETNTVAAQFNGQMQAYQLTLKSILQPILLTDYGKLSIVGKNIDSEVWTWDDSTTTKAVSALSATTTQAAYSALLPPTWPLVELKPDLITQFQSTDVTNFICLHPDNEENPYVNDPFGHVLVQNQFQSLFQLVPLVEKSNNEVWTWAKYDIYSSFTERPTDSTFADQLFSTSVDAAGAGAYAPAWYRSTYNPPDFVRCGSTKSNSSTEQHPAKPMTPTEAGYSLG